MSGSTLSYDLTLATIRQVAVTSMDNNVYLLTSKEYGSQVLIDAAGGIKKIRRMLAESASDASERTHLSLIVTTHAHYDHIRALRELADEGVRTACGKADAAAIEQQTGIRPDVKLRNGDDVVTPGLELKVIGLRGHTPGSIALAYSSPGSPTHLFTGDSLFPGGVGNTNGDPERFESLFTHVVERIFDVYPDDTFVHPGHGASTTVGAERPKLAEWRARGW